MPTPTRIGAVPLRASADGIKVGDVLNHIFEVKRFIARGGMGEVFEGCNVNSDERVAIKVMLPALAQDPNVISMFRKEARTLTRLQHEALVQYRVLAQEPQLGVLYIVTEYIDGVNLADVLGTIDARPEEIEELLRRLASGLRAAHALGAIHRDMSPDNVLLEGGRLHRAKIIDFGIAKDLDPGSATIVGDGFAGKLNYVAPEQLGDFGREIGPWTDVYSLGLVILAVAGGRDVRMGGTLVDAVDKRRAGPDLSAAPERLRPVLEQMLRPKPAERLRSMDEVLAALDRRTAPATAAAAVPAKARPPKLWAAPPRKPLLIGGGAAAAAIAIIAAAFFLSRGGGQEVPAPTPVVRRPPAQAAAPTRDPADAARSAINAALPSIECSWLDILDLPRSGERLSVRLSGVAGVPARAQNAVSDALSGAGLNAGDIDFSQVAQIEPADCSALDAYRRIRPAEETRLSVAQRAFEITLQNNGERLSKAIIDVRIGDPSLDLAVAGIEPSGNASIIIENRAQLRDEVAHAVKGEPVADMGNDSYRLTPSLDHPGWWGLLLLTGKGPFEPSLVAPPVSARGSDWRQRLLDTARQRGWQAEIIWFKSVDEQPG
jgi:serine/threonine-protein kinase